MAWTAPTTRSSGALITASIWNTDLVDNLAYLKASPVIDTAVILGAATTSGIRLDLESGTLAVREGDDSAYGPIKVGAIAGTGHLALDATKRIYLDGSSATGDTWLEELSSNQVRLVVGNSSAMEWTTTEVVTARPILPSADNAYAIGSLTYRWSAVYAANGTIQTSDRAAKRDISGDTLGLPFILNLQPVSFVMRDETDGVRRHGLIAQDLIDAAGGASLRGIVTGAREGEYGINYAGLVPALIKSVQAQQAAIEALQARVE